MNWPVVVLTIEVSCIFFFNKVDLFADSCMGRRKIELTLRIDYPMDVDGYHRPKECDARCCRALARSSRTKMAVANEHSLLVEEVFTKMGH